jgi:hypothetical protein
LLGLFEVRDDAGRWSTSAARGCALLARLALAAGDNETAAGLLREALGPWRGSAFAGDAQFAGPVAVRLDERRLAAAEDRFDAELRPASPAPPPVPRQADLPSNTPSP